MGYDRRGASLRVVFETGTVPEMAKVRACALRRSSELLSPCSPQVTADAGAA